MHLNRPGCFCVVLACYTLFSNTLGFGRCALNTTVDICLHIGAHCAGLKQSPNTKSGILTALLWTFGILASTVPMNEGTPMFTADLS